MKTKTLLLLILLSSLLTLNVFSQVSPEWISTYHFGDDKATSVATDNSGNVYVSGYSYGDSATNYNYATVKYNSSGAQQWVAIYNGPGSSSEYVYAMAVDVLGNVYVTGGSRGISSGLDYATIKYNSSGVQQWAARYNGPGNSDDEAMSIAVDISGNVYVTGYSFGSSSEEDYATVKYNSSGVQQWVTIYNGTGNGADRAFKLTLDGSGNVYVTGESIGGGKDGEDYLTVKYNSSGAQQWAARYNGSEFGFDRANSIAVSSAGNVYVTGSSYGDNSQTDYTTIKYNSSGDSLWVKRFDGPDSNNDDAAALVIDNLENVYITGTSYANATDYDYATLKYNSSGVVQWNKRYNGTGNGEDEANSIALDKLGNIYVTGSSFVSGSGFNYATLKYNNSGTQQWSQTYNGTANGVDNSLSVATDTSGNVYITGRSEGSGQMQNYVTIKYSQSPYAQLTGFIEGFYNSSSNKTVSDTVRVQLRNTVTPYVIIDLSKSKLDSAGNGRFYFSNVTNAVNYYIVLKHRNSIETWSNFGYSFSAGVLTYNFSNTAGKAYGSNQTQIDNSPVRFGIYSGDVNQDGIVDLVDGSLIDNDAYNFVSGYVATDLNGDNAVDVSDAAIAGNNAYNFVSKITP